MRRAVNPQKSNTRKNIIQSHSSNAEKVSADIEAFLNRGGKVEAVDSGITGFEDLHTSRTYSNSHIKH
ncbi:MAG: hypothetical protein HRU38_13070 [Saccharospirillaceae bacterium]|nr:hypothetical protein [Pseudomonadales bacterium]NRB79575.1 hypothetical protein [Saccharospirillaceae bacterium]